jgi:hypothetical protein
MRTKLILPILIASFAFTGIGCKQKSAEVHHHEGENVVLLDGGKKWLANAETTQGIQAMMGVIETYQANPTSDVKQLKENLERELTGIFQKCTMKGDSHDQLHNYLLPLREKLKVLANAEDEHTVEEIKLYLETYKDYFE